MQNTIYFSKLLCFNHFSAPVQFIFLSSQTTIFCFTGFGSLRWSKNCCAERESCSWAVLCVPQTYNIILTGHTLLPSDNFSSEIFQLCEQNKQQNWDKWSVKEKVGAFLFPEFGKLPPLDKIAFYPTTTPKISWICFHRRNHNLGILKWEEIWDFISCNIILQNGLLPVKPGWYPQVSEMSLSLLT